MYMLSETFIGIDNYWCGGIYFRFVNACLTLESFRDIIVQRFQ
jgi:hypothetical protein